MDSLNLNSIENVPGYDARAEGITDRRKQQERIVREGSFNARRLADIVNYIRLCPDDFPE